MWKHKLLVIRITNKNTRMHACMHTYIHTYTHTYVRTYVRTYIQVRIMKWHWINLSQSSSDFSPLIIIPPVPYTHLSSPHYVGNSPD
jgi:hypothetical protein